MYRFFSLLCVVMSCPATSVAQGMNESNQLMIEFEVSSPDANGKIVIEPKSRYNFGTDAIRREANGSDKNTSQNASKPLVEVNGYNAVGASEGFAFLDKDGELLDVYAAPVGPEGYQYLVEKIPDGGTMKPVSFFGGSKSLPTMEEVRLITEASVQQALDLICDAEPRPESMAIEVALAASLGLEGKFQLNMEWRPARDCK